MQEAIEARHSVRAYKDLPLSEEIVKLLEDELVKLNNEGQLQSWQERKPKTLTSV